MYGIFKLIKEHFKDKVYVPEISSWGAAAISSFFSFCENSFSKEVSTVAKNTGFMRFPYTHIRRHSVRTNTCKASLWSFFSSSCQLASILSLRPGALSPWLFHVGRELFASFRRACSQTSLTSGVLKLLRFHLHFGPPPHQPLCKPKLTL